MPLVIETAHSHAASSHHHCGDLANPTGHPAKDGVWGWEICSCGLSRRREYRPYTPIGEDAFTYGDWH